MTEIKLTKKQLKRLKKFKTLDLRMTGCVSSLILKIQEELAIREDDWWKEIEDIANVRASTHKIVVDLNRGILEITEKEENDK